MGAVLKGILTGQIVTCNLQAETIGHQRTRSNYNRKQNNNKPFLNISAPYVGIINNSQLGVINTLTRKGKRRKGRERDLTYGTT